MAKKTTFKPEDLLDDQNVANGDEKMIAAMEKARQELTSEDITIAPEKKGGNTPKRTTKKTNSLSAREIMTQKESSNPTREMMTTRHDAKTEMKLQINELLPNITIDLNNITISDSLNSLDKQENLDVLFNSKPTFQVSLPQSCYTAYMEALKYVDIDAISNSTMDEYNTTLKMYQIIYNRIQATSIGNISFDTFCECTSFFDLQSLFYGLHMQTFPGTTKFDFTCIHCKHKFSQDIPNDSLIFSKDEAIFDRLNEVANNADTPDKVKSGSLLAETERVCLDQSKTIFDIRIPSLKNQLELLHNTPSNKLEEMADDLATLLFIKNVYVLNVPETIEKKTPIYYPVTSQASIINILKQLSINDSKQLSKAIEKWTDRYKTEYRIPSFKCPSCKEDLGHMPIDMENVLFRLMLSQ